MLPVGAGGLAILRAREGYVVVPVAGRRRAVAGDGVATGVLRVIGDGAPLGRFRPVSLGPAPEIAAGAREVAIDVDQSNESTIVGDAAV